jgi:glycosyltransferase involved in cell wall biosynthesis
VTSVAVVIPVRDAGELLAPCLATVGREVRSNGATLVVVDDGSSDASADLARDAGAELLALPVPSGPYRARNVGWRASDADVIVFTDVRCRAEPGWLAALVDVAAMPDVAVAAGSTTILAGRSLAARTMHALQPWEGWKMVAHPFLPWAPAANLALRRDVLELLDGFLEVRSGSDVDLCWRAQLRAGRFALAQDARMSWEPRPTLAACVGQWYRYGRHHPELYRRSQTFGAELPRNRTGLAGPFVRELVGLGRAARHPRTFDVEAGLAALRLAECTGQWVGRRAMGRKVRYA